MPNNCLSGLSLQAGKRSSPTANRFPNKMARNEAENHNAPKQGEHNPFRHPSRKLPQFYQPCEEKEANSKPNDELWNIGDSN